MVRFEFLDKITVKINALNLKIQSWGMKAAYGDTVSEKKKRWYHKLFKK